MMVGEVLLEWMYRFVVEWLIMRTFDLDPASKENVRKLGGVALLRDGDHDDLLVIIL